MLMIIYLVNKFSASKRHIMMGDHYLYRFFMFYSIILTVLYLNNPSDNAIRTIVSAIIGSMVAMGIGYGIKKLRGRFNPGKP